MGGGSRKQNLAGFVIMFYIYTLNSTYSLQHQLMTNYFDREVKRRAFVVARWDFREMEKREIEAEIKKKAGVSNH